MSPATNTPNPQYYAMALWSRFGDEMLGVEHQLDTSTTMSVYASQSIDGTISVLAINKTSQPIETTVRLAGTLRALRDGVWGGVMSGPCR